MDLICLDDSGSSYQDVFWEDNCLFLGLHSLYKGWDGWVPLSTANGTVWRETVVLEVNMRVQHGAPLGPWAPMKCCVGPGYAAGSTRCSGMHTRKNLFTATAPDGLGRLFVAGRKNGMVVQLPVV